LVGKRDSAVEFVASQERLAVGVVDHAAFGSRGSCGGDPAMEAARSAGCKELVQRGSDRFGAEERVIRDLGDAQRLVPPS
jgi:hypothetical protein